MNLSRGARAGLAAVMALGLAIIYVPLLVVLIISFNADRTFGWPPSGLTFEWWTRAWDNAGAREALATSVKAGLGATAVALVLGTMVAFAVPRYRFFGREAVSLLVVLPIALPGIVTGIALSNAITTTLQPLGVNFGLFTVVVGHATFCIVVVYNNVLARLRRTGGSLEEASMDLGADVFQTFRYVTFPPSGRRCSPAPCSPSRCPSTRSSSRRSPRAPACRPCRSGSSPTCPGPTRPRWSTWSRPSSSSGRSCRSSWRSGCRRTPRAAGSDARPTFAAAARSTTYGRRVGTLPGAGASQGADPPRNVPAQPAS